MGAPIFNRKTILFTLTAEGKIYIETIEKILLLEQQTHDRIQDMQEIKENCIYFALHRPAEKQSFSIAHGKTSDSPTFKLVNEFIRTAKDFFNCENPLKQLL